MRFPMFPSAALCSVGFGKENRGDAFSRNSSHYTQTSPENKARNVLFRSGVSASKRFPEWSDPPALSSQITDLIPGVRWPQHTHTDWHTHTHTNTEGERVRERESERGRESEREWERESKSERESERESKTERESERERNRDREWERERIRERERESEWVREEEREWERVRARDKERVREEERERELGAVWWSKHTKPICEFLSEFSRQLGLSHPPFVHSGRGGRNSRISFLKPAQFEATSEKLKFPPPLFCSEIFTIPHDPEKKKEFGIVRTVLYITSWGRVNFGDQYTMSCTCVCVCVCVYFDSELIFVSWVEGWHFPYGERGVLKTCGCPYDSKNW